MKLALMVVNTKIYYSTIKLINNCYFACSTIDMMVPGKEQGNKRCRRYACMLLITL
jgi:hypothetical protein